MRKMAVSLGAGVHVHELRTRDDELDAAVLAAAPSEVVHAEDVLGDVNATTEAACRGAMGVYLRVQRCGRQYVGVLLLVATHSVFDARGVDDGVFIPIVNERHGCECLLAVCMVRGCFEDVCA